MRHDYAACPFCESNMGGNILWRHIKHRHSEDYAIWSASKKKTKSPQTTAYCEICDRQFATKNAARSHYWRAHTDAGKEHASKCKPKGGAWNKGLTAETSRSLRKAGDTFKRRYALGEISRSRNVMGEEARARLSARQSSHNSGGRSKWYKINGVTVQGSWELGIAQRMNDDNIAWIKPGIGASEHTFSYLKDGKKRRYTPDFWLPDHSIYLEVKGYWWGNDREKMKLVIKANPNLPLMIIEKTEFDKIMLGEPVWSCWRRFEASEK